MSVSITSLVPGQGTFVLSLTKTGIDTANLDIKEYIVGAPTVGTPETDNSYDLFNIKVVGGIITCQTKAMFMTPSITISLSAFGNPPSVSVAVTHALFKNGITTYAITDADLANLKTFLTDSAFPNA